MKKTTFMGVEFFHHFHPELLAYLFLALLIMSRSAWADIAVYKQVGPHIIPIKSEDIAIEEEHLEVTMHREWSRIKARLILKNNGARKDLKVGLPQVSLYDKGMKNIYGLFNQGRKEGLWDVSLTVDGNPLSCLLSRGKRARDDDNQEKVFFPTDQGTLIEIPVHLGIYQFLDEKYDNAVLNWLSWDLQFQPGQKREISIMYSVENCSNKGHVSLVYLLRTARLWQNGRIKKLTMQAEFDESIGTNLLKKERSSAAGEKQKEAHLPRALPVFCQYEVRTVRPGGYQLHGRNLTWSLNDFEPEDFSIDVEMCTPRP